jgi:hypothetical protein
MADDILVQEKIDLALSRFKLKRIALLNIKTAEWEKIFEHYLRLERLSPSFSDIVIKLAEIRHEDYDTLLDSIRHKNPTRQVAIASPIHKNQISIRRYKRQGDNPLIVNPKSIRKRLLAQLTRTGVTPKALTPASPQKGYRTDHLMRTPHGHKVHAYSQVNGHTLFKPLTPKGNKSDGGRLFIEKTNYDALEPAEPIEFSASLASLLKGHSHHRRVSQKHLMGLSCKDLFEKHGTDTVIHGKSHDFHWSHLIAFFLGGPHHAKNLFASTATANYNMLEVVEHYIAEQLINKKTDLIQIKVTPFYGEQELIPMAVEIKLNFTRKNGKDHHETFHVNPQSFSKVNALMHRSINLMREFDEADDEDELKIAKDTHSP